MAKGMVFGLLSERTLPDDSMTDMWDRIIVDPEVKRRAHNFLLFALLGRHDISTIALPVHGIILLAGPPGTGKTTLARGLADRVARRVEEIKGGKTTYAEFDSHGIGSGVLGETPKHMDRIFEQSIPDIARNGAPTCILLDEVENIAVARRKTSLEANPMDVHRTTNALLTGVDMIREEFPNVVFLATSNYPESIDDAFLSRVDLTVEMPVPGPAAIEAILADTIAEVTGRRGDDANPPAQLVDALSGWDARQIRKLVVQAIVADDTTAADPAALTWDLVLAEARRSR